jgi:non-ribosomal peptide synthetase component E (peptide arylation enzyme)
MSTWQDLWTGESIGTALSKACTRFGAREAMVFENGTVTYRQLHEMSGLLGRGLLALGVRKGD